MPTSNTELLESGTFVLFRGNYEDRLIKFLATIVRYEGTQALIRVQQSKSLKKGHECWVDPNTLTAAQPPETEVCPTCEGSGSDKCERCKGLGTINTEGQICSDCRGTGRGEHLCRRCGGNFEVPFIAA